MQHRAVVNHVGYDLGRRHLSTKELASILRVQAQTIRAGLCRKGHYLGLIPRKLPNRLLLWSISDVERLLGGRVS